MLLNLEKHFPELRHLTFPSISETMKVSKEMNSGTEEVGGPEGGRQQAAPPVFAMAIDKMI